MAFNKGMAFLREQQELAPKRRGGMKKLWLRSGEFAQFWFVSDLGDITIPLMHMVERRKQNGETYNADVLCTKTSFDDSAQCGLCESNAKGPWPRTIALVYVEMIVHQTKKDGSNWTPAKAGTKTMYKEDVGEVWMLIMKEKLASQLETYISCGEDPLTPRSVDTLRDRPFRLQVEGEKTSKQEILKDRPPLPKVPDAVQAVFDSPPDIDAVIVAEFGDSKMTTVASGRGESGNADDVLDYSTEMAAGGGASDDDIDFD